MNRSAVIAAFSLVLLLVALYAVSLDKSSGESRPDTHVVDTVLMSSSIEAMPLALPDDTSLLSDPSVQAAIDQLSSPTKIVERAKHRPETLTPLRLTYGRLKSTADSGDAGAALDLAGSLIACAEAPANAEGLERQLLDLYQTRRVSGYAGQVQDLDGEADNLRDRYEFCRDISRTQIKEAYKYLRVSAENGNIEAAVRLNSYGSMRYEDVFDALKLAYANEQEMHLVTNRLTFEAAEAGSASAILRIGRYMEEGGDLLSTDQATAYRIAGLHLAVLHGANSEHYGLRIRDEFASIRPSYRAQTVEAVNEILRRENCCLFFR